MQLHWRKFFHTFSSTRIAFFRCHSSSSSSQYISNCSWHISQDWKWKGGKQNQTNLMFRIHHPYKAGLGNKQCTLFQGHHDIRLGQWLICHLPNQASKFYLGQMNNIFTILETPQFDHLKWKPGSFFFNFYFFINSRQAFMCLSLKRGFSLATLP